MYSNKVSFLLFDSAKAGSEIITAKELNDKFQSLYNGRMEEDLEGVAPYLFDVCQCPSFISWYLRMGWNKSWGTLILSRLTFEEVYKHFQRFLMVKIEDGLQLYFRFYDPRVLRIFLPTCDKQQLKEFFGPVQKFIAEDEDAKYALIFSLNTDGSLHTERIQAEDYFGPLSAGTDEVFQQTVILPDHQAPPKEQVDPPATPGKRKWYFLDE